MQQGQCHEISGKKLLGLKKLINTLLHVLLDGMAFEMTIVALNLTLVPLGARGERLPRSQQEEG